MCCWQESRRILALFLAALCWMSVLHVPAAAKPLAEAGQPEQSHQEGEPPTAGDEASQEDSRESGFIGIGLEFRDGLPVVGIVLPGSPASRAGLAEGDRIVAVDGVQTRGVAPEDLAQAIRGKPGTSVSLEVVSPDGQARRLDVARAPMRAVLPFSGKWTRRDRWSESRDADYDEVVRSLSAYESRLSYSNADAEYQAILVLGERAVPALLDALAVYAGSDLYQGLIGMLLEGILAQDSKPKLIALLPESDGVAGALAWMGAQEAVPLMIDIVREPAHAARRPLTLRALGMLRSREAVPVLCELLESPRMPVAEVANALALIGDRRAIPTLVKALNAATAKASPDDWDRLWLAVSLHELGEHKGDEALEELSQSRDRGVAEAARLMLTGVPAPGMGHYRDPVLPWAGKVLPTQTDGERAAGEPGR